MKSLLPLRMLFSLLLIFMFSSLNKLTAQAACSTAVDLTIANCNNGDLQDAQNAAPTGTCGSATSTSTYGVWYKFTASATTASIALSNKGSNLSYNTTYIQVLNDGVCGSMTAHACQASGAIATTATAMSVSGLTVGATYYIRIYVTTAPTSTPGNRRGFTITLQQSPANDIYTSANSLTSATTCTNTTGMLSGATASSPAVASTCAGTPGADVWYQFVAQANNATITLSSVGSAFTSPNIQLLSFSGGTFTSLSCATSTSLTVGGLTSGITYYVRVYSATTLPAGCNWSFNICVTHVVPPANDDCASVTTLTAETTCSNTAGTLAYTTASSPAVASTCAGTPGADVWYRFTAQSIHVNVALSSIGSSFSTAGARIQLFSGTCGNVTSLACVSGNTATLALSTNTISGLKLEIGKAYYVRVYSPTALPTTGTWTYNICVTDVSARIDYSRSYINVTKGTAGGVVEVGDTLEMRATFVIRAKTVDSLSFVDTLYNTRGLRLVPGSLALRTNEGKVYGNTTGGVPSPFTDALDTDAGWRYTSGLDTVIRINFGTGATNARRGQLSNTSRPSFYSSTCIVMATYRVVVYAPYNSTINFKTGALTYRDPTTDAVGAVNTVTFAANQLIVYRSPGLCPNAVSATNTLGAEFNGTFGTPGAAPLARNRGTSPYTSYMYTPFTSAGGPQDYYYGIANNTSQVYTTINTWGKPDNASRRVFNVWDITGDHTGASNLAQGNPACDTTQPVSASNPCGYMLVINSAYRADTAFTYTVNNLCPNTYYEISGWFKNICYKCGCDSLGVGASGAGYIPSAPGDSSGVQPNLAFDVNGVDYYTTGNIQYYGTTPTGSDATNRWVKRGFTYLTGPSETSFTLTIRNNAPGGGGNDWALDDLSVATCLPNMSYSPTINPVSCANNAVQVHDTIRSYFNNYNHFKWQRSSDGGTTWMDLAGQNGSVTPVLTNSEYQYITSYTIPPTSTTAANNGDKYRVTVGTTSSNMTNIDCQVTDGISIISLTVLTDCTVLPTRILSFNGKTVRDYATLFWTTSREEEYLKYSIERSTDGVHFSRIGVLQSRTNNAEQNYYTFTDSVRLTARTSYRIAMIDQQNRTLYSRSIVLSGTTEAFRVSNIINPFYNDLLFDVAISRDAKVTAALYTLSGTLVKQQMYMAVNGVNGFTMSDLKAIPQGLYLLRVQYGNNFFTAKVMKR